MTLSRFTSNDPLRNPFTEFISDNEFQHMLEEGFEVGNLNTYSDLTGYICYTKIEHLDSSTVNMYITEEGICIDQDYDCGGNISNYTWWFDKANYKYTFEEAWNNMMEQFRNFN